MILKETLADGSTRYGTARGWVEFHALAPGVALTRHQGYAEEALVDPIMKELTALVGDRPFKLFVDVEHLEKYDPELRSRWVDWFQGCPQEFQAYFLVGPSFVTVAVQIAKLVLGDAITSFTDRTEFEGTLRQAIGCATLG